MILRDPGARGVSSGVAAVAVLVTAGGSPFAASRSSSVPPYGARWRLPADGADPREARRLARQCPDLRFCHFESA
jgi:hypothetical protein